jgi:hypothetical protein
MAQKKDLLTRLPVILLITKGYTCRIVILGTIQNLNGNVLESVSKDLIEMGYFISY